MEGDAYLRLDGIKSGSKHVGHKDWDLATSRVVACALVVGVLVVLALALAHAAPVAQPYRAQLTGKQFVQDMLADPRVGANVIQRERAMGYMRGAMDASAGQSWCPAGKALPHELDYLAAEALSALPPAQLRGNAAPLIVSALRRLYPCRSAP